MFKLKFLVVLFSSFFINAHCLCQNTTLSFAEDLKKLIALNNSHENILNFSGPEAVHLLSASPSQIIEITSPWHHSVILNAKGVCFYLLSQVLVKKEINQQQKEEIVEIICGNYLTTDRELQTNDNVLLLLHEKDFNDNAKKYIAALVDSIPRFNYDACARLSAIAQVKKNIPFLWTFVDTNIYRMQKADIDVLASLARLGEKKAADLLCTYYSSDWNKRERSGLVPKSYVSFAGQLAFSLDRTVLDCLAADFRKFDLQFRATGSDYSWWPGQHLGIQIAAMLKNYPYPKDFQLDPFKLLAWLNSTDKYELTEK